ncbi:MAG: AI-2E family transporter [Deltaproteobacteria bacterium]|nr:AI-2E family transporter [Deltaproteobacteria bacterium]
MRQYIRKWIDRYFSDPQVLSLIFLLVFGAVIIFWLGHMLIPFFAAIIIAYLLEGIVLRLERVHMPRKIAILAVFLLFIASLIMLIVGLVPLLLQQIGQLLQEIPSMVAAGQKRLMLLPEKYPDFISEAQINHVLNFFSMEFTKFGQHLLSFSLSSLRGIITLMVYLILVPLMVYFFLKDKNLILQWASAFLPENRGMATEVWAELNRQITNYIRGKSYEILIVWGASYILFILLKLQFAMLLSVFVGLSVLIPYIGAIFMFFPVTLIAFFQWGIDINVLYTMVTYIILQMLDGNLLAPLLLSGVVNLHPVAIILAILIFGGLWGFWGLVFAIPLATLIHAVMKAWINRLK